MRRFLLIICLCTISACGTLEMQASMDVKTSRAFSGPSQFPPSGFAGYGLLIFPTNPEYDPERFQMFCKAYHKTFLSSASLANSGVPIADQMVTLLPVASNELAIELEALGAVQACNGALTEYDLALAQNAIKKAEAAADLTDGLHALTGRGPFLLAWAPGRTFGSQDALVLAADLSNSSTSEQAGSDMRIWRRDIEQDPSKWREGWNVEGVRLLAQRWVDRHGATIIKLIGDWE